MSEPAPAIAGSIAPQDEEEAQPATELPVATINLLDTLTFAQAGVLLGVSRTQVQRMHKSGQLGPAVIIFGERCFRISRAELRAWAAAGCPPRREWLLMKPDREGTR